ncbi:MAG: inositol monophosphatase [Saccharothrix sp.]|nr:inositol monophosphatase [Saccharothrix sp.]
MKRSLDQLAEIAQKAVDIGSDLIKNTRPQTVTEKSDRDTYTDVDVRIEQQIRAYLAKVTPEIEFIGEEGNDSQNLPDKKAVWVLDPIDGTANFVHKIPLCAVQIALIHDRTIRVAAINLPYMGMKYHAARGMGAYSNGRQIKVSSTEKLAGSIVSIGDYATGRYARQKNQKRIALTSNLAENVERIRMFGSAAHDLAWTAEGRTDAAVILSNKIHDIAAGALIAQEAGALVLDSSGNPYTFDSSNILVATPAIADAMLRIVQAAEYLE